MANCVVCDKPSLCEMCAESVVMFQVYQTPEKPEPEVRCVNVVEQTQKLINICSGEDVCLS